MTFSARRSRASSAQSLRRRSRARVAKVLNHHSAAGRLTVDELSDRTNLAYAATTLAELSVGRRPAIEPSGGSSEWESG